MLCIVVIPTSLEAQNDDEVPVALRPDIQVEHYMNVAPRSVRLVMDEVTGNKHYNTLGGDIYRINTRGSDELLYSADDHGITRLQGMTFHNGALYLSGNASPHDGSDGTIGLVMRGVPGASDERNWETVAETVRHVAGSLPFDHGFNDIVVDPDGRYLFVNSGSITDHGEVHDMDGAFPGQRELPTTAVIFKFPVDAEDILLTHELEQVEPYYFVRGVRNIFSFSFAPNGHFFGVSNSGDYDHSEDMFWLRQGHHYGFPWIMGGTKNPQQFQDWEPDPNEDPMLSRFSHAYNVGYFYNDPDFPQMPKHLMVTPSIQNIGPDGNYFRNMETGEVLSGDEVGKAISTFTAHRSPLGLVFDHDDALIEEFNGDAFVLSWTAPTSGLLSPFYGGENQGEDLMHLKLFYSDALDNYIVQSTRIVEQFSGPSDALLLGNLLYVIEHSGSDQGNIWKITLPEKQE